MKYILIWIYFGNVAGTTTAIAVEFNSYAACNNAWVTLSNEVSTRIRPIGGCLEKGVQK